MEPNVDHVSEPIVFAHPLEAEMARLFDELGLAWEYEPRTFVLERRGGRIVEACTPDFFLPELGVYIECTLAEQRYTNRKRRKIRRVRERFGVIANVMYRHDVRRLATAHGLTGLGRLADAAERESRRRRATPDVADGGAGRR